MKPQSKKAVGNLTNGFSIRKPFIFLGLFIVVAAVIFGVRFYNQYLDAKDRERFEVLKTDFGAMFKQLESQAVSKAGWKLNTDCQQASNVYGGGTISCYSSIRLEKKIGTPIAAANYVESLNNLIKNNDKLFEPGGSNKYLSSALPQAIYGRHYEYIPYIYSKTYMQCSSSITILTRDRGDGYDLIIEFGCDDHARKLHFSS